MPHRDINNCVSYHCTPGTLGLCEIRDEPSGSLPSRGFLSNEGGRTQIANSLIRWQTVEHTHIPTWHSPTQPPIAFGQCLPAFIQKQPFVPPNAPSPDKFLFPCFIWLTAGGNSSSWWGRQQREAAAHGTVETRAARDEHCRLAHCLLLFSAGPQSVERSCPYSELFQQT